VILQSDAVVGRQTHAKPCRGRLRRQSNADGSQRPAVTTQAAFRAPWVQRLVGRSPPAPGFSVLFSLASVSRPPITDTADKLTPADPNDLAAAPLRAALSWPQAYSRRRRDHGGDRRLHSMPMHLRGKSSTLPSREPRGRKIRYSQRSEPHFALAAAFQSNHAGSRPGGKTMMTFACKYFASKYGDPVICGHSGGEIPSDHTTIPTIAWSSGLGAIGFGLILSITATLRRSRVERMITIWSERVRIRNCSKRAARSGRRRSGFVVMNKPPAPRPIVAP
jgi:hypothetical protein